MTISKVHRLETRRLEMPYTKPLVTATNNFTVARGLLVKVITDGGIEGYGYSDLFPRTGETPQTAQHVIESVLKAKVVGRDLEDLARIRADIDHALTGKPARQIGAGDGDVRCVGAQLSHAACRHARRQISQRDQSDQNGQRRRSGGDGGGSQDSWSRDGLALKLKVSGKIDKDLPRVAAVRKAVGDDVFIKIDANEAYDAKTAIRLAKGLADLGVEVFEQPVPRDQFDALWEVKKHSPIKIEADQSCRTFADAQMLIKNRMVDSINTGIPKVGSIGEVRRIAELCELNGIRCALSNTAGSMVGDAAAVHLAASTPGISPALRARRVRSDHRRSVLRTVGRQRHDQRAGGRRVGSESAGDSRKG